MRSWLAAFAFLVLLTGCGTSPDPSLYTLESVPGATISNATYSIKVVRPDVPAFLDRPEFVSQNGYEVRVNETANWAEPLDLLFERVLASDLRQRLPSANIQTDADDVTTPSRFTIETALQKLNADSGRIILQGNLTITNSQTQAPPKSLSVTFIQYSPSDAPSVVAAGLSGLLGQYADRIVSTLPAQNPK